MDSVATMGEMTVKLPKKCLYNMLLNKTKADYTREHQSYRHSKGTRGLFTTLLRDLAT